MNILIAEDEPVIGNKIHSLVKELNWASTLVKNIPELLEELSSTKVPYKVLVLDRMLGNSDSAYYVTTLKDLYPGLRIFILSAINSSVEKARLIDTGADDYLAKPFESVEFQARLRALARGIQSQARLKYNVGNLSLDLITRTVTIEADTLNLTVKEFLVLHTLCFSIGKVYGKAQLIEKIWGYSEDNETNVVEATVSSLRRKLEQGSANIHIKNTRFIGYWVEI